MALLPSSWSLLAFGLNSALDAGRRLPLDKTIEALAGGRGLEYLERELGDEIDTSMMSGDGRREANEFLAGIASLGLATARKKMGVEHDGVCLALAYCIEVLQEAMPKASGRSK